MGVTLFGIPLVILLPLITVAIFGIYYGVRGAIFGACGMLFIALVALALSSIIN